MTDTKKMTLPSIIAAVVLGAAALVVSIVAVVSDAGEEVSKSDPINYTVAFVEKAIDYYEEHGRQATLDYYNSPESVDGDWYLFIFDKENRAVAHVDPELLGQELTGDLGTDVNGYRFGEVMAAATEEGRWVDYFFLNPVTGNQEFKHGWVVRHDGLLFGSGWYQVLPTSPSPAASKSSPAEYTQWFVQDAVNVYDASGLDALIERTNDPNNMDGDWYIYVFDLEGKVLAHPTEELRGQNVQGPIGIDVAGERFGPKFLDITEEGGWITYYFRNPNGADCELKHSWAVRRGDVIIGSGWYEDAVSHPLLPSKCEPLDYTVATVERAVARYRSEGREASIAYHSSMESVDGRWYAFIVDADTGDVLAHPAAAFIGENLWTSSEAYDDAGYYYAGDLAQVTSEGIFVRNVLGVPTIDEQNPFHTIEEVKHYYAVLEDGLIFASGWYTPAPTPDAPSEYARLLVGRTLTMYDEEGLDATLDYYNSPESVDGQWYVFIIEERDGVLYSVASANRPDLVGTTWERIDANGFHYGRAFAAVTEEGGGEWVPYLFTHPETGEDTLKHTWVVRRGNLLFGAGWYEGSDTASSPYAAEAARFLASFTADHSPRASATGQELAAAQTLKAHLERLGYETVLQEFTVLDASAEVAFDPAPEAVPDSLGAQPLLNSGGGAVTAPLFFTGMALEGEVPDDLEGHIALIERGEISFQEKVQRVAAAGALAAVIYNNVDGDFRGSVATPASIPAVSIDRQTGLNLRELMGDGTVESTISVIHTESPSRNVVANKPGAANPDSVVIVGAHYDTAPNVPGANDSSSGVAAFLSVARHIADRSYPFTVRLVLFGSQINGLFGSYHYVEAMSEEERSNSLAMINFDVVGSGRALEVDGDEDLRQAALTLATDLGAAMSSEWSLPEGARSDHVPFAEAGIPNIIIAAHDISRIHTADDTLEYINPYLIGWAAEIGVALLDHLAAQEGESH